MCVHIFGMFMSYKMAASKLYMSTLLQSIDLDSLQYPVQPESKMKMSFKMIFK